MGRRRDTSGWQGLSKRFFLALLGLAGLGVGVWLFRKRKKR
ncbi:MAG: LPXTG cell wall anchor domain-containing protein [Actinomycetota bacterium]